MDKNGKNTYRYFDETAIERCEVRRLTESIPWEERKKRNNVEATIFQYSSHTRNNKTRYRGLVKFGEVHQNIIIRTVSPSVAIVSYLRQILTIHQTFLFPDACQIHLLLKKLDNLISPVYQDKMVFFRNKEQLCMDTHLAESAGLAWHQK